MSQMKWQKSSFCAEASNCVEVAAGAGDADVVMRESAAPAQRLVTTRARLAGLLAAARKGPLADI